MDTHIMLAPNMINGMPNNNLALCLSIITCVKMTNSIELSIPMRDCMRTSSPQSMYVEKCLIATTYQHQNEFVICNFLFTKYKGDVNMGKRKFF